MRITKRETTGENRVLLLFRKKYHMWNSGETAAFTREAAEHIVKNGFAEYVKPPKKEESSKKETTPDKLKEVVKKGKGRASKRASRQTKK